MLDEADQLVEQERPVFRRRVRFLRNGLEHLRLSRDVAGRCQRGQSLSPTDREQRRSDARRLVALQTELTTRHVVWGNVARQMMPEEMYEVLRQSDATENARQ